MPVVDVKDRHTHLDLGQRLEYLETKEEAVWPWEVSSQPGWQVAHTDYPSFGLDTSSHWFRFGLRNISGEIQLVMLDLRHPLLDELDVFVLENGRIKRVWNTGLERGAGSRPYPAKSFVVPLYLDVDEEIQLYFRARSDSYLMFPLHLEDIRLFANQQAL